MRILLRNTFLIVMILLSPALQAQSSNVNFFAFLKSEASTPLSNVYIRIYAPESGTAIDSCFTNDYGVISRTLPLSWSGPDAINSSLYEVPRNQITPSIISATTANPYVEYAYEGNAKLFLLDIQGKAHANREVLSPGIYFSYLEFDNGKRSKPAKFIITEKRVLEVDLRNTVQPNKNSGKKQLKAGEDEFFLVEMVKDGFISLLDTVLIDSSHMERTYIIKAADNPTSSFSFTGSAIAGESMLFDASASVGANGEELYYSWDFNDGKYGQTELLPHIFNEAGSYQVSLTVRGEYGAVHSSTQTITISEGSSSDDFTGSVIASISTPALDDLEGALVYLISDGTSALSDASGMAVLENLPVGIPLHFKISKYGYVDQVVELTIPSENKEALFFTTLKDKNPAISLNNAEFGGRATGQDGTSVDLPVQGLVRSDGTPVTGAIDVSITPVDVAYQSAAFPGSFSAYRSSGEEGLLMSYGVADYSFSQGNQELQLAPGKTAEILIPIYTSGAQQGDEIPLWSIDPETGIWIEEGIGTVVNSDASPTGLAFRAEVGHFSWWNCDDWQAQKPRSGLCYRLECTSAICYRVKVGCWMSGAMRDKKKSIPGYQTKKGVSQLAAERDDIPPVFEVRAFVPGEGRELEFPITNDVFMDARGFDENGKLMTGSYLMEGSYPADTFSIELFYLESTDTIELELNQIEEYYLEPGESMTFKADIQDPGRYRIYFLDGQHPALDGIFSVSGASIDLITGEIGFYENWIEAEEGSLIVNIGGNDASSEGYFQLGIAEEFPQIAGDTLDMDLNSIAEGVLEPEEVVYYRLSISEAGLYMVDLLDSDYPSLDGQVSVWFNNELIASYKKSDIASYFLADPGEYILCLGGRSLYNKGSYKFGVWETSTMTISLGDSVLKSMSETDSLHLYELRPDHDGLMSARFYQLGEPIISGKVRLLNQSGKVLGQDVLYNTDPRINHYLDADTAYFFEVTWLNGEFDYVLIPEEDPPETIQYGDTIIRAIDYKYDRDFYYFTGSEGDVISIRAFREGYDLNYGQLRLLNSNGEEITRREVRSDYSSTDYEIIYKLPESGEYGIEVYSTSYYTGEYKIMLNKIEPLSISPGEMLELEVEADTDYYLTFEQLEANYLNFSGVSDNSSGNFRIWNADCDLLYNTNANISTYYSGGFSKYFLEGEYFIRIENDNASRMYLNLVLPEELMFNEKGKASFIDTISEAHKINAYILKAESGTGLHGIIRKNGDQTAPKELKLNYNEPKDDNQVIYPKSVSADYRSLDTTILNETGLMLEVDSVCVMLAYAKSAGSYEFNLYRVSPADTITVDDDFADNPGATTASPIAAGYAINSGGSIEIANGLYKSYLPVQVEKDSVILIGNDRDQVIIRNIYNYSNHQCIYFLSSGNTISGFTLQCGDYNYEALEVIGESNTLENILINPIPGWENVSGGIKCTSKGAILRDITMDHSSWGIKVLGNEALIEDCNLTTYSEAISYSGINGMIRNNLLTVLQRNMGISITASGTVDGINHIQNNELHMMNEAYADGTGVINVTCFAPETINLLVAVHHNTIYSAGSNEAFNVTVGNPPSMVLIENNSYYGSYPLGGKALVYNAGRTDGSSKMIARNNTFDGLSPHWSVILYALEYVESEQLIGIYNNNFRVKNTVTPSVTNNFIYARISDYAEVDTVPVKIVNNIFEGGGLGAFMECSKEFSIFSDYNVVYNFGSYINSAGTLLGTTNDILTDPQYLDEELHIPLASPAVDHGAEPALFPGIPELDKEGNPRPTGSATDIGAYEK